MNQEQSYYLTKLNRYGVPLVRALLGPTVV